MKDGEHETILRYRPDQGTLKLRIILDRNSLEVFVNDGEQAASAVLYTRQEA